MINFSIILLIVSASFLYLISYTTKRSVFVWQTFFFWSVFAFLIVIGCLWWQNPASFENFAQILGIDDLHMAVGVMAGIVLITSFIPYITSIVAGNTKPERATWCIWSLLSIILLPSYYFSGGRAAIWTSIGGVVAFTTVAALSLRKKYGIGSWTKFDRGIIAGCGLCLLIWWLSDSAVIALTMAMVVDALGAILTIKKMCRHPQQEDRWAWVIAFAAHGLNLFAVEQWNYAHAAYPIYLFLEVGLITALVLHPMKKRRRATLV